MSLLAADTTSPVRHASGFSITDIFPWVIAALVLWVVLYLVYRVVMTGRKDFGMPVRRRLLCRHLNVHLDQNAEVPFWWTDLQVQRAVRSYWRQTLRSPFAPTPPGAEAHPAT